MHIIRNTVQFLLVSGCIAATAVAGTLPKGWNTADARGTNYDAGLDSVVKHNGKPCIYLKCVTAEAKVFGNVMQAFSAEKFRGKRIKYSAYVKTEEATLGALLWMRMDAKDEEHTGKKMLVLDNMHDRPITGTNDWKEYDIVLDVPADAYSIQFGILLDGTGAAWYCEPKIVPVGNDIPVTAKSVLELNKLHDAPVNLDFDE